MFAEQKPITACFTGHRLARMDLSAGVEQVQRSVAAAIGSAVVTLYERGYRRFLCGMADGFDLWAGAEVVRLGRSGRCEAVELVAVVPFEGHRRSIDRRERELYDSVLEQAATVEVLAAAYSPSVYHRRNDFLVDNSSAVVAFYMGGKGGTDYTLRRARRQGLPVVNICQPELFEI